MASISNAFLKSSQPPKKRHQYNWLTNQQKCDLIFCVIYLNESLKEVCADLRITFSQAVTSSRSIRRPAATTLRPLSSEQLEHFNVKVPSKELSECPLGIVLLDDSNMKLVASKSYREEEEAALKHLHSLFCNQYII
eukprot:TRINITY_DN10676_c0_g3_i3.p1 TRINITY_DN10676_c0_g3~~TRINITY_DN10676_c0_g3_i3.p1  ORF type:complete len:137 (-),score=20.21 TRINITY_DN10676_c0_g3_i3:139-549(-)